MKIAVIGVAGRMGQALVRRLLSHPELSLCAAVARPGSDVLGADAGMLAGAEGCGVAVTDDLYAAVQAAELIVDFSTPFASLRAVAACVAASRPMVIGTTGYSAEELDQIHQAAGQIAIVFAPNMSIGVNVSFKLAQMAAAALGDEVDVEVIEAHHRDKVDAPSGTAVRLGEVLAETLGRDLSKDAIYGRQGQVGARDRQTIGFSTIRGGDIVGEHTVLFAGTGERLEITHRASSRDNFASGALRAAQFLADRPKGLFDMQDVLGLS